MIHSVSVLKDRIPNLKILLAGNGPLEKDLKAQVEACDLQEIVKFLGYRTDLEKVVPAVDLVVSCSYREGLPLNIIEAMLCKKPVVASTNRGHLELITDGHNGYLFNPNDWEKLANDILKVYEDANRFEMGARSYEIAKNYTVEAVKKEIKGIYC